MVGLGTHWGRWNKLGWGAFRAFLSVPERRDILEIEICGLAGSKSGGDVRVVRKQQ